MLTCVCRNASLLDLTCLTISRESCRKHDMLRISEILRENKVRQNIGGGHAERQVPGNTGNTNIPRNAFIRYDAEAFAPKHVSIRKRRENVCARICARIPQRRNRAGTRGRATFPISARTVRQNAPEYLGVFLRQVKRGSHSGAKWHIAPY